LKAINKKINEQLFLGYDVGKGFVTAADDVIHFIPHMIENTKIASKLKQHLEGQRAITIREMGMSYELLCLTQKYLPISILHPFPLFLFCKQLFIANNDKVILLDNRIATKGSPRNCYRGENSPCQ